MTEAAKTDGIFDLTQPVPMTFPQLFEAKAFQKGGKTAGEPKFSGNFNFPIDSEDLKALKTLAAKLARAKWPDKPFTELVFPFANGDKLADERKAKGKNGGDFTRGKVVIAARSKYEPELGYIENGRIVELSTPTAKQAAKGKFYPGVLVYAQFNLVPYDAVGSNKPGVTAYLNKVLSTVKGERLAGGKSITDTFKGYVGAVSMDDPTAPGVGQSLADEIPY
jgi:hypothetical protein